MKTVRKFLGTFSLVSIAWFFLMAVTLKMPDNHVPNTDPWGFIILIWLGLAIGTGFVMAHGEKVPAMNIGASVAYGLTIWWTIATPGESDLTLSSFQIFMGNLTIFVVPTIQFLDLFLGYLQKDEDGSEVDGTELL